MNSRTLLLTSILFLGVTFQNCSDPHCVCCDLELRAPGDFFDIEGIGSIKHVDKNRVYFESNQIRFEDYDYFSLDFMVDYISFKQSRKFNFSLMNSAFACSPLNGGYLGSKEESIESFQVITINDFDDEHSAGDSINDLLDLQLGFPFESQESLPLEEFLNTFTDNVPSSRFKLILPSRPTLNNEFQVRIEVVLSTGEQYEETSSPLEFL